MWLPRDGGRWNAEAVTQLARFPQLPGRNAGAYWVDAETIFNS
jgi:hypothetical protein